MFKEVLFGLWVFIDANLIRAQWSENKLRALVEEGPGIKSKQGEEERDKKGTKSREGLGEKGGEMPERFLGTVRLIKMKYYKSYDVCH